MRRLADTQIKKKKQNIKNTENKTEKKSRKIYKFMLKTRCCSIYMGNWPKCWPTSTHLRALSLSPSSSSSPLRFWPLLDTSKWLESHLTCSLCSYSCQIWSISLVQFEIYAILGKAWLETWVQRLMPPLRVLRGGRLATQIKYASCIATFTFYVYLHINRRYSTRRHCQDIQHFILYMWDFFCAHPVANDG